MPSDISDGTFESSGAMENVLHDMGKRPTWVGSKRQIAGVF